MEKLIQRIRGVMHLLLIWSLLLCWVASIEPVDIHRLCLDLEINWNKHLAAMRNSGTVPELSLASPADLGLRAVDSDFMMRLSHHHQSLGRLRYANLSGDSSEQPGVTAARYLEECEQTLQTVAETAQTGHPAFSTNTMTMLFAKIEEK